MTYLDFKYLLERCSELQKDFKPFYEELKLIFKDFKAEDFCEKFKIETEDAVFYFDIWFESLEKNQKQTAFLISKYNKDRTILFNSFRLDIENEDKITLFLTMWKKTENDYLTKVKQIVLNKQEFKI